MYSLIIFCPILALFCTAVFSSFGFFSAGKPVAFYQLGGDSASFLVLLSTFVAILLSLDALTTCFFHSFSFLYYLPLSPLFNLGWVTIQWGFFMDPLTVVMCSLITTVSFFIQLFSLAYMGEDASRVRFMVYLCFFMVSMLLLVGSGNLLQIFFGWELVGLASFLLINFWFSRSDANLAAFKAMAFNRVGDCFFILAMILFAYTVGSWDFDVIFCLSFVYPSALHAFGLFFLVIAAFAKSAQFFFHSWLPDAMEGPTPVSALLHSATMVTAGVFLILRCMDLLEIFPVLRYFVIFFGLITAFYAMAIAAVADDTKRVTAYTTLNQLGFMFYGCGALAAPTVLFHLVVHGFYKSFSFLTAAIELHDFEDEQDGEADQLETPTPNVYDLLSSLVFISVNAIPFSSPSVSKEFMLLSGLEGNSSYFSYLTTLILFTGLVDEGRDDVEGDFSDTGFYVTDLHVSPQVPGFMLAGCSGLGVCSIFSASFLEEFFVELAFTPATTFFWLDVRGSLLISLPFFALIFAEFDTSASKSTLSDFNASSLFSRTDPRYQSVIFNAELWSYDRYLAKFSSYFYSFAAWQSFLVLDKGFLEALYVSFPVFYTRYSRKFFDILYSITVERVVVIFIIFTASWFFFSTFLSLILVLLFSYTLSSACAVDAVGNRVQNYFLKKNHDVSL
jgi:NADH:ubiquinone oxidoreductase subunit 5 (subunit L)/multisubunit Na+/H+ antiporter MnhA subunit